MVRVTDCYLKKAGPWSASGEQLYCASLVSLGFYSSLSVIIVVVNIVFYFISIIKLFLSYATSLGFFQLSSSLGKGQEESE